AEIRVDFSVLLNESLHAGDLDIAVLTAPAPGPLVTVEPLVDHELRWVASPKLALGKGTLKPADLAAVPIITNPNPSNLYTSITGWFAAAGVQPVRIHTCNSLVIMTRLALEGAGISLLPIAILRKEIRSGALRALTVAPKIPAHRLAVAYRRDAPGPGLRTLSQMIQELNLNVMLSQRGVLNLAHTPGDMREAIRRVYANRLNGIDAEWLDARQVKDFCPIVNISPDVRYPVLGATLQRRAGVARHDAVAWGYARAADALGVDIIQGCEVTGFDIAGGRVRGVKTSKGTIGAGRVGIVAA